MARYQGRHRPSPGVTPDATLATPAAGDQTGGRAASALNATLSAASHARTDSRHAPRHESGHALGQGAVGSRHGVDHGVDRHALRRSQRRSRVRARVKPVLASAVAVGLLGSGVAYARSTHLPKPAAFVVGSGVIAQTGDIARATTVDLTSRAAASVSRNERRRAIAASGARDAQELAAKQKAAAKQEAAAAEKAAAAKAEAARVATEKAKQKVIADAKRNPQAVARLLMADQGWTSDTQYRCLVNLWTGESDWRWWAENASSSAYGIPQSLPARKMAQFGDDYRTNPVTQIKWGLWYIKMSYGNPCNAWATWQARSPHWY